MAILSGNPTSRLFACFPLLLQQQHFERCESQQKVDVQKYCPTLTGTPPAGTFFRLRNSFPLHCPKCKPFLRVCCFGHFAGSFSTREGTEKGNTVNGPVEMWHVSTFSRLRLCIWLAMWRDLAKVCRPFFDQNFHHHTVIRKGQRNLPLLCFQSS